MKYLVAVSGGVDSVVLLDILLRQAKKAAGTSAPRVVVAHVDHGIRTESAEDARFVQGLARHYGVPFVSTQLALGADASEDAARQGRYAFLYEQAEKFGARLVTAHHLDDMIGSIAINIMRGTGWRGLAVLNRPDVDRPLLGWAKADIYDYALAHRLEWVEDATNQSPRYLRNRLRSQIMQLSPASKQQLVRLRAEQQVLARDIDRSTERLIAIQGGSRYFYTSIDTSTAIELLRTEIDRQSGTRPTIQQAERTLMAIKTAGAGSKCDVGDGLRIELTKQSFIVAGHLR